MQEIELNDIETAGHDVVFQAARGFASALTATSQYLAFKAAAEKLEQDWTAKEAIRAFQVKQQELQALQKLNAIPSEEKAEFERLRQAFLSQPSVTAYFQAQADLAKICLAAGDLLSSHTGLNFGASACSSGCCG